MSQFSKSILPPNSSTLLKAVEKAVDRRKVIGEQSRVGFEISRLWIPESYYDDKSSNELREFLPFFAWGLGITVWDKDFSADQKINLIKTYFRAKQIAGTPRSIVMLLKALGIESEIETSRLKPFLFRLNITGYVSAPNKTLLENVIDDFKPVRSTIEIRSNVIARVDIPFSVSVRIEKEVKIMQSAWVTKAGLALMDSVLEPETPTKKLVVDHVKASSKFFAPEKETNFSDFLDISDSGDPKKLSILDIRSLGSGITLATAQIDLKSASFKIGSIGFFTEDGTLAFLVSGQNSPIASKLPNEILNIEVTLSFENNGLIASETRQSDPNKIAAAHDKLLERVESLESQIKQLTTG